MILREEWNGWTDWSPWNEAWFPSLVYSTLLVVILSALGFTLARRARSRAIWGEMKASPLLWIGAGVAILGAAGTLWNSGDWARAATVIAGSVLVLAHVLAPRIQSLKYRDVELLLSEVEKAEGEGNEEQSKLLMHLLLQRLWQQTPTAASSADSGTQTPQPRAERPVGEDRGSARFRASQYEKWVFDELVRFYSSNAVMQGPRNSSIDFIVRRGNSRVSVDARLGVNFPIRDYVSRVLGERAVVRARDRWRAHVIVVDVSADARAFARASSLLESLDTGDMRFVLVAAPGPTTDAVGDSDDLRRAVDILSDNG